MVGNNVFVKVLELPSDGENKLFNKEKLKAIGLIDPRGSTPVKIQPQQQQSNNYINNNSNNSKTATPVQKK